MSKDIDVYRIKFPSNGIRVSSLESKICKWAKFNSKTKDSKIKFPGFYGNGKNGMDTIISKICEGVKLNSKTKDMTNVKLYENNKYGITLLFYNENNSDKLYVTIDKYKNVAREEDVEQLNLPVPVKKSELGETFYESLSDYRWLGTGKLEQIDSFGNIETTEINFIENLDLDIKTRRLLFKNKYAILRDY